MFVFHLSNSLKPERWLSVVVGKEPNVHYVLPLYWDFQGRAKCWLKNHCSQQDILIDVRVLTASQQLEKYFPRVGILNSAQLMRQ